MTTKGVGDDGKLFDVPQVQSMPEGMKLKNVTIFEMIAWVLCIYFTVATIVSPLPIYVYVVHYMFWRISYDLGIGIILHFQSKYQSFSKFVKRNTTPSKDGKLSGFGKFLIHLQQRGAPVGFTIESYPNNFKSWLVFKHIENLILWMDGFSFGCLAIRCGNIARYLQFLPSEWQWVAGNYSQEQHLPMWLEVLWDVFGLILIWVNWISKVDAHNVVGAYAWFWGDFFFLAKTDLTFDGIYLVVPHPMYTIGYSSYYGISILSRSYIVFALSLFGHLLQMLFLYCVEEPHMNRIYGSETEDAPRIEEIRSYFAQSRKDQKLTQNEKNHIRIMEAIGARPPCACCCHDPFPSLLSSSSSSGHTHTIMPNYSTSQTTESSQPSSAQRDSTTLSFQPFVCQTEDIPKSTDRVNRKASRMAHSSKGRFAEDESGQSESGEEDTDGDIDVDVDVLLETLKRDSQKSTQRSACRCPECGCVHLEPKYAGTATDSSSANTSSLSSNASLPLNGPIPTTTTLLSCQCQIPLISEVLLCLSEFFRSPSTCIKNTFARFGAAARVVWHFLRMTSPSDERDSHQDAHSNTDSSESASKPGKAGKPAKSCLFGVPSTPPKLFEKYADDFVPFEAPAHTLSARRVLVLFCAVFMASFALSPFSVASHVALALLCIFWAVFLYVVLSYTLMTNGISTLDQCSADKASEKKPTGKSVDSIYSSPSSLYQNSFASTSSSPYTPTEPYSPVAPRSLSSAGEALVGYTSSNVLPLWLAVRLPPPHSTEFYANRQAIHNFRQFQKNYDVCEHMHVLSFVLLSACLFVGQKDINWKSLGEWRMFGGVRVMGVFMIALSVIVVRSIRKQLGLFGWYYGDFFMTPRAAQQMALVAKDKERAKDKAGEHAETTFCLRNRGVYRYLNHPATTVGALWMYGLALVCESVTLLTLALFCHLLAILRMVLVEQRFMNVIYGTPNPNSESGIIRGIRQSLKRSRGEAKKELRKNWAVKRALKKKGGKKE
ncbi:phosphatidylethanolamine N-methyltransferase [Monocercomonoides exilis]|uniref:phosphatidylethanolamine N-methyltransferase n=1 Tax=Monocercomonoides exilis TaxID=2049356 RepID=UPI003559BB8D|nr:phosphatidylethanolamine N-methyltransferase [Monocercomonoides exilis]|eukprot:MONOS_5498.1-p1 / transcript=MONOS_5498.1 / gene=MONOS_5498 / organism=Monocercomonoides_exilis_PA203 / gene_product=phosphatidylethanolamine N-methyltransferase [EC:2.1.1.17] / transcript_product=phosphatidylethanolamine N-methyltransferase [EC:2.1.1.17] / location=Mono_scaffold00161:40427-43481(+) / protein_length=1000 / sequence_SO=supercontig / SO=protein_coding / is_pseudo=false